MKISRASNHASKIKAIIRDGTFLVRNESLALILKLESCGNSMHEARASNILQNFGGISHYVKSLST